MSMARKLTCAAFVQPLLARSVDRCAASAARSGPDAAGARRFTSPSVALPFCTLGGRGAKMICPRPRLAAFMFLAVGAFLPAHADDFQIVETTIADIQD